MTLLRKLTSKRSLTRTLILWTVLDLTNLLQTKVKVAQRHPNNNPPDSGDDGNGPGGSDSSSSDDSKGSEALRNSAIVCSIRKGLSGLFANIDDNRETAQTSNPEPFEGSNAKALNTFFTACTTTFIGSPKAYKKQCSHLTYTLSFL